MTIRDKNRIIAEAVRAGKRLGNPAFYPAFKKAFAAGISKAQNSDKIGSTVFNTFHLRQYLSDIGSKVMIACVAGGKDSRSAVQRLYHQSGVISYAGYSGLFPAIISLDGCVFLKGAAIFNDFSC